jgi:hypothetical protein
MGETDRVLSTRGEAELPLSEPAAKRRQAPERSRKLV